MFDLYHVFSFFTTVAASVAAVMLHYEAFILFSRFTARSAISHRQRILLLLFGILIIHVAAIWIFGISAWWLVEKNDVGVVSGYEVMSFLDYIFMSAVTYTTLGYGDMIPMGPIRFLYGTQSLVGFVLITWSASYTFLEMQRNWNKD
ncbi:ion channel [Pseudohongiella sp. SYSU M77423]|uniref:ion channel n=1 Tax=Pseudohongiella sp. SYSU M77423 TaxID=3042312 RepID=UPI002480727B|nr:ion channel [Pseudohongiella sp. SYSU M77423]MDH7943729.1 ion channel [Pseudohongiella sp. SYSU M77423]